MNDELMGPRDLGPPKNVDETVLYQAWPKPLTRSFSRALVALVGWTIMALLFKPGQLAFWVALAFVGGSVWLLVRNVLFVLVIREPMLTLRDSGILFRKMSFRWEMIADLETREVSKWGSFIGLVPTSRDVRLLARQGLGPIRNRIVEKQARRLRTSLARYGAILIPQAKGMTVDELRDLIEEHRVAAIAGHALEK